MQVVAVHAEVILQLLDLILCIRPLTIDVADVCVWI